MKGKTMERFAEFLCRDERESGDHRDVPAFPAGICRVGGGLEDYQGTVVRLEEGLSGLEYRLESVNAMLAAIRASAGTAWHC